MPDRPGNGYLGGQWKWSNGKPWNYINWDNGQPLNEGSDDCVMIRSKDGLWEDFACTSRLKVRSFSSICDPYLATLAITARNFRVLLDYITRTIIFETRTTYFERL